LKCHIARDFQDDDPHKHELISQVDSVLFDLDIRGEASGEGTRKVHTIQLKDEKT
jgi:hypothetical protein